MTPYDALYTLFTETFINCHRSDGKLMRLLGMAYFFFEYVQAIFFAVIDFTADATEGYYLLAPPLK
jgi:hypothetical protein